MKTPLKKCINAVKTRSKKCIKEWRCTGVKQDRKLYYFHKDSGLEIDFVTKVEDDISLIEVKVTTGNSKSASTVLKNPKYEVDVCYKLSENNIGRIGNKITIPYYMAMFL
ncbi:MAG: hypothetical protein J5647_02250 [Spirochaetaceae bacterium]|nr:hypothetical protein [Spirochaetaceae bacterium]